MEELLNTQFAKYELIPNQRTLIGNKMGLYYISQDADNTISTILVSNYDQIKTFGFTSDQLKFESDIVQLYVTYTGENEKYPIRVRSIALKL